MRANVFLESAARRRVVPAVRALLPEPGAGPARVRGAGAAPAAAPLRGRLVRRRAAGGTAPSPTWARRGSRRTAAALLVDHLLVGRAAVRAQGRPAAAGWWPPRRPPAVHRAERPPAPCRHGPGGRRPRGMLRPARAVARSLGTLPGRAAVTMAVLEAALAGAASDAAGTEKLAVRAEEALASLAPARRSRDRGRAGSPAAGPSPGRAAARRRGTRGPAARELRRQPDGVVVDRLPVRVPGSRGAPARQHRCRVARDRRRRKRPSRPLATAPRRRRWPPPRTWPVRTPRSRAATWSAPRRTLRRRAPRRSPCGKSYVPSSTAVLERSGGREEQAGTRLEVAADIAELAGPWAAEWVRQERTAPRGVAPS